MQLSEENNFEGGVGTQSESVAVRYLINVAKIVNRIQFKLVLFYERVIFNIT